MIWFLRDGEIYIPNPYIVTLYLLIFLYITIFITPNPQLTIVITRVIALSFTIVIRNQCFILSLSSIKITISNSPLTKSSNIFSKRRFVKIKQPFIFTKGCFVFAKANIISPLLYFNDIKLIRKRIQSFKI